MRSRVLGGGLPDRRGQRRRRLSRMTGRGLRRDGDGAGAQCAARLGPIGRRRDRRARLPAPGPVADRIVAGRSLHHGAGADGGRLRTRRPGCRLGGRHPVLRRAGHRAAVAVVVRNGGLAASSPTELALFAGDPAAGGQLLGSVVLPALPSGASTTLGFTVATAGFSGMVALFAVADRAGTVDRVLRGEQPAQRPAGRPSARLATAADWRGQPGAHHHVAAPDRRSHRPALPLSSGRPGSRGRAAALRAAVFAFGSGMALDPDTGLFTWTPAGPTGVLAAVITVRDAQGAATTQRLEIRVLDTDAKAPPQFDSTPLSVARPGGLYQYTAQATDPDGGAVVVSAPADAGGHDLPAGHRGAQLDARRRRRGRARRAPAGGRRRGRLGRAIVPGHRQRRRRRRRRRPDGPAAGSEHRAASTPSRWRPAARRACTWPTRARPPLATWRWCWPRIATATRRSPPPTARWAG